MPLTLAEKVEFALRDAGWNLDSASNVAQAISGHAAMVAKLRELTSIKTSGKQRDGGDYSRTGVWDVVDPVNWRKEIKLMLSADPVEPDVRTPMTIELPDEPVRVDVQAVREVIYELTRKEVLHAPYVMRCADKLSVAIGDTK